MSYLKENYKIAKYVWLNLLLRKRIKLFGGSAEFSPLRFNKSTQNPPKKPGVAECVLAKIKLAAECFTPFFFPPKWCL